MKTKAFDTRRLVLLSVLAAILLVMSFTPLGYLNIGPLAISLNMIPVAMAAVAMGPLEGAILGGIFGITSFLQCLGIGGVSQMGVILFEISPVLAFVQRFVPRVLAGLLAGLVLFGNTEYLQGLIGGRNVIVFICAFVGINAVVEMLAATFAVGLVGTALHKAKLIK